MNLERTAEAVCYALLGPAMLAPRFIVSPAAVAGPSMVTSFERMFPLPFSELQARRLAGLPRSHDPDSLRHILQMYKFLRSQNGAHAYAAGVLGTCFSDIVQMPSRHAPTLPS